MSALGDCQISSITKAAMIAALRAGLKKKLSDFSQL
jgi:hypothetical protein